MKFKNISINIIHIKIDIFPIRVTGLRKTTLFVLGILDKTMVNVVLTKTHLFNYYYSGGEVAELVDCV
jgi:hypothetical protein